MINILKEFSKKKHSIRHILQLYLLSPKKTVQYSHKGKN